MDEIAPQPAPSSQRPLVYVCFGTCFNRRLNHFKAVLEALAEEPVDVLVSTGKRDADDDGVVTPGQLEPLPPNIVARDFVAGREVLSRARVHVTHGGCNSVHESLLAGVPMVVVPQAFDQAPLGKRIDELGAGLLAGETPESIRGGVRRLLGDDRAHVRAGELSRHLVAFDGRQRIAELFERLVAA
jgi:MGT family glycosyltransferase